MKLANIGQKCLIHLNNPHSKDVSGIFGLDSRYNGVGKGFEKYHRFSFGSLESCLHLSEILFPTVFAECSHLFARESKKSLVPKPKIASLHTKTAVSYIQLHIITTHHCHYEWWPKFTVFSLKTQISPHLRIRAVICSQGCELEAIHFRQIFCTHFTRLSTRHAKRENFILFTGRP